MTKLRKVEVNNIIMVRLLQISIAFSVLSQINSIPIMRIIMYGCWILTFGCCLFFNRGSFIFDHFTKYFFSIYILYLLIFLSIGIVNTQFLNLNYIQVLAIPLLMSIIGNCIYNLTEKNILLLEKTYIVSALVYALWVNMNYFNSYSSWLLQNIYTFSQKNSAAQIWCFAALLLIFAFKYNNVGKRLFGYVIALYLFLMIGIVQCRTALLAIVLVFAIYALLKSKRKIRGLIIILFLAFLAWNLDFTREFIDQALFLNKYSGTDLNTFSSGRLDLWNIALKKFLSSPVIGSGTYYVDCSYILVLAESGLIGFLLIESVWLYKIITNFRCPNSNPYSKLIFCATIFYIVESFLEGYPPFGPGVSSFMFWLIGAIVLNKSYNYGGTNE